MLHEDEMRQQSENLGVALTQQSLGRVPLHPAGDFLLMKDCFSLYGRCFSALNFHSYGSWGVKHNPGMLCRDENPRGDHVHMDL